MNYASPIPAKPENRQPAYDLHASHSAEPFSRWQHFALAMVPMVLAEMYIQGRDFWSLSMVAIFIASLATVIFFVRALNRLEDWEAQQLNK